MRGGFDQPNWELNRKVSSSWCFCWFDCYFGVGQRSPVNRGRPGKSQVNALMQARITVIGLQCWLYAPWWLLAGCCGKSSIRQFTCQLYFLVFFTHLSWNSHVEGIHGNNQRFISLNMFRPTRTLLHTHNHHHHHHHHHQCQLMWHGVIPSTNYYVLYSTGIISPPPPMTNMLNGVFTPTYPRKGSKSTHPLW